METTVRSYTPWASGIHGDGEGALTRASSGAHAPVNSIAEAADAATGKARPAIDQVAAMAHKAVDQTADAAAPAADWLVEQGENLNATRKKLLANACSYISANPLKSVGIAVFTGILLSRMIR